MNLGTREESITDVGRLSSKTNKVNVRSVSRRGSLLGVRETRVRSRTNSIDLILRNNDVMVVTIHNNQYITFYKNRRCAVTNLAKRKLQEGASRFLPKVGPGAAMRSMRASSDASKAGE